MMSGLSGPQRSVLGFLLVMMCGFLPAPEQPPTEGQAPAEEPSPDWESDPLTLPGEVRLNRRQPPDVVLKTIGIKPGMVIGEVGAGRGRYTVQIASRIGPTGHVYANDIDEDALRFLERRAKEHDLKNVETVRGDVTDPKLPVGALDMAIMVNVVHCLEDPVALLRNLGKSLKPDSLIVIVEGNLDKNETGSVGWFTRSKLLKIYEDAGYDLVREEMFLPLDNIYFLREKSE